MTAPDTANDEAAAEVDTIARDVFGWTLRPAQREAVDAVIAGRDTLAVLPTGSGKSAIYQVAGLVRGGLTVVVSPLLALQRDQLRSLATRRFDERPVRAAQVNSGQHTDEHAAALAALREGELDFVLLGPEQLGNERTHEALLAGARPVTLVTVDEAHLVSDWGHDFRPDYLHLPQTLTALGRPPVLALTATAAPPVQADVTRVLEMRDALVVVSDFDRPNISLAVRHTQSHLPQAQAVDDRTVEVVLAAATPALVYATSRARCKAIAERLDADALSAAAYHGAMKATDRKRVQDRFFAGELDVVVATSAFGMGIDKPDVRTVVHAGMPASVDDYYQQIGRAGRDGEPAAAVMVYDRRTIAIPRLLAARSKIPERAVHAVVDALEDSDRETTLADLSDASGEGKHSVQRLLDELAQLGVVTLDGGDVTLNERLPPDIVAQLDEKGARHQAVLASRIEAMRGWAESPRCRRAELLAYFGENYDPPCGNCDNDRRTDHASEAAPTPVPGGVPVHHNLWGRGTLLSRDDHELVVVFDSVGYRHLTPRSLRDHILTIDD